MKKEKNKVGRPRLADKKLKKKALLMVLFSVIIVVILTIAGSVTTLSVDTNRLKAASGGVTASVSNYNCDKAEKEKLEDGGAYWTEPTGETITAFWCGPMTHALVSVSLCEGKTKDCISSSKKIIEQSTKNKNNLSISFNGLTPQKNYTIQYYIQDLFYTDPGAEFLTKTNYEFTKKPAKTKKSASDSCSLSIVSVNKEGFVAKWNCGKNVKETKDIRTSSKKDKNGNLSSTSKTSISGLSGEKAIGGLKKGKTYYVEIEYRDSNNNKKISKYIEVNTKDKDPKNTSKMDAQERGTERVVESGFAEGKVDDDIEIKPGSGLECDNDLKTLIQKYWGWVMILGPIGLMILITIDFVKAVVSSDADMLKKSGLAAFKRTLALVILLFTPFILNLVLGWFGINLCF